MAQTKDDWVGFGSLQGKFFEWANPDAAGQLLNFSMDPADNTDDEYAVQGSGVDEIGDFEIENGFFNKKTKILTFKKRRVNVEIAESDPNAISAGQEQISDAILMKISFDATTNTIFLANESDATQRFNFKCNQWTFNGSEDQKLFYCADENVIFGFGHLGGVVFLVTGNFDGRVLKLLKYDFDVNQISKFVGGATEDEEFLYLKGLIRIYPNFNDEDTWEEGPFNFKGPKGGLEVTTVLIEEVAPEEEIPLPEQSTRKVLLPPPVAAKAKKISEAPKPGSLGVDLAAIRRGFGGKSKAELNEEARIRKEELALIAAERKARRPSEILRKKEEFEEKLRLEAERARIEAEEEERKKRENPYPEDAKVQSDILQFSYKNYSGKSVLDETNLVLLTDYLVFLEKLVENFVTISDLKTYEGLPARINKFLKQYP